MIGLSIVMQSTAKLLNYYYYYSAFYPLWDGKMTISFWTE